MMMLEWIHFLFQRPHENSWCSDLVKLHECCDVMLNQCHIYLALVQHLSPFTGFQLGLQLGWHSLFLKQGHTMQAFWEHLQHAVSIYEVKVNTNKMIFMVEWGFQEVWHNQPSWPDSILMLIYIFGTKGSLCNWNIYSYYFFCLVKRNEP